jgi:acyl-CoA dehydrogenase
MLPASEVELTRAAEIAQRVSQFVRDVVVPYETDSRYGPHGPTEELVLELRGKARNAGVLTPHILSDGSHLSHRELAVVLRAAGWSPLGIVAVNVAAPDEGNMFLLSKVATAAQRERFLDPLVAGTARSAFFMTEPAADGGAGSDPSMLQTEARLEGDHWLINGRKAFITGAFGASIGIVMAKADAGATLFLTELPVPGVRLERPIMTLDQSMPGGHWLVSLTNLRVPANQVLGEVGAGFAYAQIRLGPARLTHCSRWLGACLRAQHIATGYATRRTAFGKALIDHEGVGFQLVDNLIDLKSCELMIDWAAAVLDSGSRGIAESSMVKVAAADALFRVADRCVQIMGGTGVSRETIVEQIFREIRSFRIYDGPTEVHKWSLAKKIRRDWVQK